MTENQVSRIPFLSKDMGEVQRGGLTVFISSEDFIGQKLWGRLMSGLEADFGAIHIIHGEEQEAGQRHSEHSISLAESLEDAVHDNQVFLFARAGGWNGLYTEDGIKSPLYYILEQWIHAEGRREYGGGWAACRACQDGNDSMTLLAWNTSEEQISEFQILFEDKICLLYTSSWSRPIQFRKVQKTMFHFEIRKSRYIRIWKMILFLLAVE